MYLLETREELLKAENIFKSFEDLLSNLSSINGSDLVKIKKLNFTIKEIMILLKRLKFSLKRKQNLKNYENSSKKVWTWCLISIKS